MKKQTNSKMPAKAVLILAALLGAEAAAQAQVINNPQATSALQPSQQQIDQLQQQIRDLQTQPPAGEAATVNGAPVPETTQRTQQAG